MFINRVEILGFVGRKPEVNKTKSGTAVCNLSVATNSEATLKDGTKRKDTEWHNITVWGDLALLAAKNLDAGKKILVIGELKTKIEKKGNVEYPKTSIKAVELKFIDGFSA